MCFVQTNSFQCVLATNGSTSFALFIYYHKGSLQWSAGDADPERSYTIGVNAGDGVRYMSLHEESTSISSLASLSQQSNVDINGMWVLRVDSLYAKIPDWKGIWHLKMGCYQLGQHKLMKCGIRRI